LSLQDDYAIILTPVVTESAFRLSEEQNKMIFIVARKANKQMIKEAFERLFRVRVAKVNTTITPRGLKRAYITLDPEFSALDLATQLGIF